MTITGGEVIQFIAIPILGWLTWELHPTLVATSFLHDIGGHAAFAWSKEAGNV